jgi:hypothetical protein
MPPVLRLRHFTVIARVRKRARHVVPLQVVNQFRVSTRRGGINAARLFFIRTIPSLRGSGPAEAARSDGCHRQATLVGVPPGTGNRVAAPPEGGVAMTITIAALGGIVTRCPWHPARRTRQVVSLQIQTRYVLNTRRDTTCGVRRVRIHRHCEEALRGRRV